MRQIHLFGEGKVNQPANLNAKEKAENAARHKAQLLLRFKWGV